MRPDQMAKLKESVERVRTTPGFVEWIDDDETQHVVTDVTTRETENQLVAILSEGGFVILSEADPTDFREVQPAIPYDCPGPACEHCPAAPTCARAVPANG